MQNKLKELDAWEREHKELVFKSRLQWVHWLIIAMAIPLTIFAWFISSLQLHEKQEQTFLRQSNLITILVQERMQLYENSLKASVAFLNTHEGEITPEIWRAYATALGLDKNYPGINGIGVIFNIKRNQEREFIEAQKVKRPTFRIYPQHQENELWPITFLEPIDTNKKAIGLDIAFEQHRYEGVTNARDLGISQATGPIVLVQDQKQTPGFLLYTPFYQGGIVPRTLEERRSKIIGVAYAPFIMEKLLKGTINIGERLVNITIKDGNEIYYQDNNEGNTAYDPQSEFSIVRKVNVYGREWTIESKSNLAFKSATGNNQPLFVLIAGIFIDICIFILFYFISRSNNNAVNKLENLSSKLIQQTKKLHMVNADLESFTYIASHDLKTPLRGIDQLTTWIKEECDSATSLKLTQYFNLLKVRINRMDLLLDDVAYYVKLEHLSKPQEVSNVDTRELILQIFSEENKRNSFEIFLQEKMPKIKAEKVKLEIVFRQIIRNAIKHHHLNRGNIVVGFNEIQNNQLEFIIKDDGPGIPSEYQERIFELFQTLKSKDEIEGSGIGLAIVKKILKMNEERISIESNGKDGSTFKFTWTLNN